MAGIAAGSPGLVGQESHDADLHRDHGLHVDRAAPPEVAIGDVGGEWLVGPPVGRCRDHVEMAEQQERSAAGPVAAKADVDGAAAGVRLEDLRGQAGSGQAVRDVARRAELAVRRRRVDRVDRRDADEVPEGLDQRLVRGVPGLRRALARGSRRETGHTPNASAIRMPITNPARMMRTTIQISRPQVLALLAQAGLGVRVVAAPRCTGRGDRGHGACLLRSESYAIGSGGRGALGWAGSVTAP